VVSLTNTGFADRYAVPVPAYILHASLQPLQDVISSANGKARFVAFQDKVNCSFETFVAGLEPGCTMVVILRRGQAGQPVGWVIANRMGSAALEMSTLRGNPVPMCQVGDVVEIWTVEASGPIPKRKPFSLRCNLILIGILE
jgi:hypothetical protein